MKTREEKYRQKKDDTIARKSEKRIYTHAKCYESREMLCFSDDLWVGWVEKQARKCGGCGAMSSEETRKIVRCCGAKHIFK